jgi:hypothetical protein
VDAGSDIRSVFVSGSYLYLAVPGTGLVVADFTEPDRACVIASLTTPAATAYGVAVSGALAFVADGPAGLHVIRLRP